MYTYVLFFSFLGLVFTGIACIWQWCEGGQVRRLSAGCPADTPRESEAHERAAIIAEHISEFDFTNKTYGYLYLLAEFLSLSACLATFIYYASLLKLTTITNISHAYTDFNKYFKTRDQNSTLMTLFPRETHCIYTLVLSYTTDRKNIYDVKCHIANELNEVLHITALTITGIVLFLYVLNLIYIIVLLVRIKALAKSPTTTDISVFKDLSLAKRLILLLLCYNIDGRTHLTLMEKVANVHSLGKFKSLRQSKKRPSLDGDSKTKSRPISRPPFMEVMMGGNTTDDTDT